MHVSSTSREQFLLSILTPLNLNMTGKTVQHEAQEVVLTGLTPLLNIHNLNELWHLSNMVLNPQYVI